MKGVDESDRLWKEQLGPVLTESAVAVLLDVSVEDVARDARLLHVRQRNGAIAYPLFQFAGQTLVPGLADVVRVLSPALEPLTIASWLTAPCDVLDGLRPIDALRLGQTADTQLVAAQLAAGAHD